MSDQKLIRLQNETGCDLVLGKLMMKFTGGDVDGAIRILKSVDKNIYVIRGKFIAQGVKLYGAFIFFYDSKQKNVDKIEIVVKYEDKSAIEFDFDQPWAEYASQINSYVRQNATEVDLQNKFTTHVKTHKAMHLYDSKIANKREIDDKSVKNFFTDLFLNITGDVNVALKIKIEATDTFEMNKGAISEIDLDEDPPKPVIEEPRIEEQPKKNDDILVLQVDPVLAPIDGVELSELSPGDLVGVVIKDERPIAEYIAGLLNVKAPFTDADQVVYAELKDLNITDHGIVLRVEFGPGIYGKAYFGENVKIKSAKKEDLFAEPEEKKESIWNRYFWAIGGLLIIAILILMFILIRP
jgi:hypothetical protein